MSLSKEEFRNGLDKSLKDYLEKVPNSYPYVIISRKNFDKYKSEFKKVNDKYYYIYGSQYVEICFDEVEEQEQPKKPEHKNFAKDYLMKGKKW